MNALLQALSEPQFAGMADQAIADMLNARRVIVRRPVPTWLVRQYAIEQGFWPSLIEARDSGDSQVKRLAITVLAWIDDQSGTIQTVDMDRPAVVQMLAALTASGITTQEQADALSALGDVLIPWTESVGIGEVGIGNISNARRTNG
jgi:hypothetical protein